MKKLIKIIPGPIRWLLRFIKKAPKVFCQFLKDASLYTKFSSVIEHHGDPEKLYALITATYHNLEKGMSLTNPRPGFGKANVLNLISLLQEYIKDFGPSERLNIPLSVLIKYCEFNQIKGIDTADIEREILDIRELNGFATDFTEIGGVITRTKSEVLDVVSTVPIEFFLLRHSVRQFDKKEVALNVVERAILVAQKSPVVCNRQSGKVYSILNKELIKSTLLIQGGARGFYEEVEALFCITTDLRNFNGPAERYQGWIDGGMFAMSFIYGLHMQGLGSCCLNWSKTHAEDDLMRRHLNIPKSERIIMFVAAGYLKEEFNVAKSERKNINIIHKVL